jgi:hypothetical protein
MLARTLAVRGAVVGVAVLGLAACGGTVDAGSGSTDGETDGLVRDVDADGPLLQVHAAGGFVMPGYDFASVPALTVYEDGRAITHGPQIMIFPGPVLPNLLVSELTADDVDAIVEAAREAGLLGDAPDYGQPPVADAPTTTLTITVDGETFVHAVDALGIADGTDPGALVGEDEGIVGAEEGEDGAAEGRDELGQPQEIGLTPDQVEARSTLNAFLAQVNEIVPTGDGEPYDITAFAVAGRPADGGEPADPAFAPQVVPWPLTSLALADLDGCEVVDGDDAATLLETLTEANQLTQFDQDGTTYEVWFRPLLPHETECPGGA